MSFFDQLEARSTAINSLLCVGIDPHPEDIGSKGTSQEQLQRVRAFCTNLIEQTHPYAAAFKPNSAFFEAHGGAGITLLAEIIATIPEGIPVLLDAKRGDIGSTSAAYARAAFDTLGATAITLNPYLGHDGIVPFIKNSNHGAFILCKTSNPSAEDLQDQILQSGKTVFIQAAELATTWNQHNNLGLVIGATYPETLAEVRTVAPNLWFLTPGIGAQGGDLDAAIAAGLRADKMGMLIPISRGISQTENPATSAQTYRDQINTSRNKPIKQQTHPYAKLAQALLDLGCVQFGSFTLKSGNQSPIYIDLRRLSGDPAVLTLAARAYSDILKNLDYDRLAGLPYAAIPIATAISLQTGKPLIYPRKETKEYGTKSVVEGPYLADETIAVIDDLVTTGLSKFEAIEKLQDAGLIVADVIVLIDRQSGAKEALAKNDLSLHAVFSLNNLLDLWQASGAISVTQVNTVKTFLAED